MVHVYVLLCAVSPTNISQYNLPPGSTSMSRSNSIPTQDSFDLYGEGHPLGGSATSLEDRPRAISRSGSFRDSTDEGETHTHSGPTVQNKPNSSQRSSNSENSFYCHFQQSKVPPAIKCFDTSIADGSLFWSGQHFKLFLKCTQVIAIFHFTYSE